MCSFTIDECERLFDISVGSKEEYRSIIKALPKVRQLVTELLLNAPLFVDGYPETLLQPLVTDINSDPLRALLKNRRQVQGLLASIFIEIIYSELITALLRGRNVSHYESDAL